MTPFVQTIVHQQIKRLYSFGGHFQKAADKCKSLTYDIYHSSNPLEVLNNYPTTNHGESRISHCVKYDFPGYCRLVTIQDNGFLVLIYFGTHNEVEQWIDTNRGLTIAICDAKNGLINLLKSKSIDEVE
jgi:hypothetical protein